MNDVLRLKAGDDASDDIASRVRDVVRSGGTAIVPTDTVYGIGCDPLQEAAIERIFSAKRRPPSKPLSLHFASVEALLDRIAPSSHVRDIVCALLPGAVTVIVERPRDIPASVTRGLPSLGLRVPDHVLCSKILSATGPLAMTSANLSGRPAFAGGESVTDLPSADVFVDDGPTPLGTESTIVDVSGARPRLLRRGAIERNVLEQVLGPIEDVE